MRVEEARHQSARTHESEQQLAENVVVEDDEDPGEWSEPGREAGTRQSEQGLPWVRDRLAERYEFWRSFTRNGFVLSVVRGGYRLVWKGCPPPPCNKKNAKGCFGENRAFTTEAVAKLHEQGAVRKCRRAELVCVLALDVKMNSAGKRRLCVDGRPVNEYEVKRTFKFESLAKEGRDVFAGCTHGGTVDISHAYHHITLHEQSRKYLGFEWNGEYYMFCVLPFGLQSAPWCFCTVVAECVQVFRRRGVRMVSYVDDFPHGGVGNGEVVSNAGFIIRFLRKCGFIIEPKKKCLGYDKAVTKLPALGFIIDFEEQKFMVKPERRQAMLELARVIWAKRFARLSVRMVAALAGRLVSMSLALGGVARMRTRALYAVIGHRDGRAAWNETVILSEEARDEVQFWLEHFDSFNGMPIKENRRTMQVDLEGHSDAGEDGFGGYISMAPGVGRDVLRTLQWRAQGLCSRMAWKTGVQGALSTGVEFRGDFTAEQQVQSSTWREGWAVYKLLGCYAEMLQGCTLRLFIDNLSLAFGLGGVVPGFEERAYGGSRTLEVQRIITKIHDVCVRRRIQLIAVWVPREENERADYLSKITTHYDFRLSRLVVARIDRWWGPHTVDRFSSATSVMVSSGRYNSRFWQPGQQGCEGIDAFSQHWGGENNWVHPPYKLVGKALLHMRECRAVGTIVLPYWERAAWWPLLRVGSAWARDVVYAVRLGRTVGWHAGRRVAGILLPPPGGHLEDLPVAELWAVRMDCLHKKKKKKGGARRVFCAMRMLPLCYEGHAMREDSAFVLRKAG